MTCLSRDQDLLLLAHGELSLPRRIVTQAHLRRCASCRERYRQLAGASHALAGVARDPLATPWSPALNRDSTGFASGNRLPLLLTAILLGFVTIVTIVALYMVFNAAALHRQNAAHPPSVPSQGCAPGLPNDQCR